MTMDTKNSNYFCVKNFTWKKKCLDLPGPQKCCNVQKN